MAIKDNLQPFWGFNVQGITKDDGSANDAFISSLQSELDKTELDLYSSKLETYLDTANGRWLDYWGRWLGLHRDNRSDDDYRTALTNHVLHERNTIPSLTKSLSDFLKINQDHIYIYEPWRDMFVWNASHYNTHKFFTDPYYRYAVIDIQIEGPYSEIVNEIINLFRPAGVYWVVTSLVNVINNTAPILDLSVPTTQIIESSDTDYANFTQTNSAYLNSKLDLATYVGDPFNYNKDNLNAGKQYATSNSSYNPVVYIGSNQEDYDTILNTIVGGTNLLKGTSTKDNEGPSDFSGIPVTAGENYTFSGWWGTTGSGIVSPYIQYYDSKGNKLKEFYANQNSPLTGTYFTLTGTAPANAVTARVVLAQSISSISITYNSLKFEHGSQATPWSPNPSDSTYASWLQTKQQEYYSTTVETNNSGTNLLTNTGDLSANWNGYTSISKTNKYNGYPSMVFNSSTNQLAFQRLGLGTLQNLTQYTASFWAKADNTGDKAHTELWGGIGNTNFVLTTDWEHYTAIVTSASDANTNNSHSWCYFGVPSGNKGNVYIAEPKLEIGTTATPWSPNPSDSNYASWLQTKQQAELGITSQNLKQQLGAQITTQPTLISSIDSQANSFTVDQTQTSLLGGIDLLGYLTVYKQAVKSSEQTAKQFILANLANSNTQRLELVLQNQANIDLTRDVRLELYDYNLHLWVKPIIEYEVHSDYTIFKVSLSSLAPYLSDGGNFMFQVWPTIANITTLSVNYLGYLFNAPSDIITLANSAETFTMETN